MEKNVNIKLNIEGNAKQSVTDLKKELKDAKSELFKAQEGTEQYNKALQRLASAKDRLKDMNMQVKALADTSDGVQMATQHMIGGFQTLTGVMQVMGGENKELVGVMSKMQGALNLVQGINSLKDLKVTFDALKIALLANPIMIIGAVIAAIGVAMYALKDKLGVVGSAFSALGKGISWIVEKFKDLGEAVGLYNRTLENLEKKKEELKILNASIIEDLEREQKVQTALGNNTVEIETKKIQLLNERLKKQIEILNAISKERELNDDEKKELADFQKQLKDNETQLTIISINENKKREEEKKKAHEEHLKRIEERKAKQKESIKQQQDDEKNAFDLLVKNTETAYSQQVKLAKASNEDTNEIEKEHQNELSILYANELARLETQRKNGLKIDENYFNQLKEKQADLLIDMQANEIAGKNKSNEIAMNNLKASIDKELQMNEEKYSNQIELAKQNGEEGKNEMYNLQMQQLQEKLGIYQKELDAMEVMKKNGVKISKDAENQVLANKKKISNQIILLEGAEKQRVIQNEKDKLNAKINNAKSVVTGVSGLLTGLSQLQTNLAAGDLAKEKEAKRKAFEINKGVAAVNTVMNTAEAVTKIMAQSGVLAPILEGIAIASGAVQLAAILSQKFPEDGGTGASMPSSGGSASSSMQHPQAVVPQGHSTENIPKKDNQIIKAVVVETDIRATQQRVNSIIENAAF